MYERTYVPMRQAGTQVQAATTTTTATIINNSMLFVVDHSCGFILLGLNKSKFPTSKPCSLDPIEGRTNRLERFRTKDILYQMTQLSQHGLVWFCQKHKCATFLTGAASPVTNIIMSIYMAVVGTAGTYKQVGRLTLQIPKAVGKAFQIIGRLIGQHNKNGHSDGKKSQKKTLYSKSRTREIV